MIWLDLRVWQVFEYACLKISESCKKIQIKSPYPRSPDSSTTLRNLLQVYKAEWCHLGIFGADYATIVWCFLPPLYFLDFFNVWWGCCLLPLLEVFLYHIQRSLVGFFQLCKLHCKRGNSLVCASHSNKVQKVKTRMPCQNKSCFFSAWQNSSYL